MKPGDWQPLEPYLLPRASTTNPQNNVSECKLSNHTWSITTSTGIFNAYCVSRLHFHSTRFASFSLHGSRLLMPTYDPPTIFPLARFIFKPRFVRIKYSSVLITILSVSNQRASSCQVLSGQLTGNQDILYSTRRSMINRSG